MSIFDALVRFDGYMQALAEYGDFDDEQLNEMDEVGEAIWRYVMEREGK